MSLTNYPKGLQTFLLECSAKYKTSDYTVTDADSGKTFYTDVDALEFTLPAITSGKVFTFVNTAEDGFAKIEIKPNVVDGIMYATVSTDDYPLVNTKLTQKKGDRVVISNVARTDYWAVTFCSGIWTHGTPGSSASNSASPSSSVSNSPSSSPSRSASPSNSPSSSASPSNTASNSPSSSISASPG
jgi:hypothetical protein